MQIYIISGWRGARVFSQAGGQPVGGESQKRVEVSQDRRQFGRGDGRNGKNQRSPTQVELGYVEANFAINCGSEIWTCLDLEWSIVVILQIVFIWNRI